MKFFVIPFLLFSLNVMAQCKSSRTAANGEVINCIDKNDLKQGRWVNRVDGVRGEPGYMRKKALTRMAKKKVFGDCILPWVTCLPSNVIAGNKDGVSQYFNIAGLMREESWKAVNPDNPYDTIDVIDPYDDRKITRKVIKIEGTSVKHGKWKYYDASTGYISKTEQYFLGKIEDPKKALASADGGEIVQDSVAVKKPVVKAKPQAVLDFEKKNAGKKKVKYNDGKTF